MLHAFAQNLIDCLVYSRPGSEENKNLPKGEWGVMEARTGHPEPMLPSLMYVAGTADIFHL